MGVITKNKMLKGLSNQAFFINRQKKSEIEELFDFYKYCKEDDRPKKFTDNILKLLKDTIDLEINKKD